MNKKVNIMKEKETKRHNKVIEILFELCKKYNNYKDVYADHINEKYKKIPILSNNKKILYNYQPDIWCKLKSNNKKEIFEVWDSQSEDACVGDILLSALTEDINFIYIICFEKSQYDLALKLVEIVLSSIFNEKGEHLLPYLEIKKYITLIPEEIIDDENKVKNYLHDKLKF